LSTLFAKFSCQKAAGILLLMNASGKIFLKKPREYAIIGAGKPPPGFSKKL
jgi:hypothetical protein